MQRIGNKTADSRWGLLETQGLFVLGFALLYFKFFFQQTTFFEIDGFLDSALLLFGALFLLLHCAMHIREYGHSIFLLLVAFALTALVYVRTGETAPFVFTLVVASSATAGDLKRILKTWLIVTSILMALLCIMYSLLLAFDPGSLDFFYRKEHGAITATRYAFFFVHPNMPAAISLMIVCAALYLKRARIGIADVLLALLFAVLVYFLTRSRTSGALLLAAPFLFYLQQHTSVFNRKWVRALCAVLAPLLFIGIYLVSGPLYSDGIGSALNGRVWLWHACYQNQGLTLFGQHFVPATAVTVHGWNGVATTLDSFYANGLFVFGIAFSLLFCWAVARAFLKWDDGMGRAIPFLLVILAFGITEGHILNLVVCPLALLLGASVLPEREKGSKTEHRQPLQ
ncbi:MAG: hypothetical protein IKF96_08060 [Eggerthellaceae bacterium]|nr:hypothetical protein [Eggerthellaceae bacterium]